MVGRPSLHRPTADSELILFLITAVYKGVPAFFRNSCAVAPWRGLNDRAVRADIEPVRLLFQQPRPILDCIFIIPPIVDEFASCHAFFARNDSFEQLSPVDIVRSACFRRNATGSRHIDDVVAFLDTCAANDRKQRVEPPAVGRTE